MCQKARAAPKEPPASPAAGCIQIFLKMFFLIFFHWLQFSATPPARQRFSILNSFLRDVINLISFLYLPLLAELMQQYPYETELISQF